MTFEDEFRDLMHQSVTITKAGAPDAYGHPAAGASSTVVGRFVATPKMIRATDGREVVSAGHFYTAGPAGIEPTDTIVLPDGSSPKILRVDTFPDEDADHHQVVYV